MTDREICELMNTDVEQGLYKLIEKYNAYGVAYDGGMQAPI